MLKTNLILGVIAALIIGVIGGYYFGSNVGYTSGYTQAGTDIKKIQEDAARKASEEATKAANPFTVTNPLGDATVNPFDKAKKVLNPFE